MDRGLITALFLIGAIVLYFMGMVYAATGVFILGGVFEMIFWVRLFSGSPKEPEVASE